MYEKGDQIGEIPCMKERKGNGSIKHLEGYGDMGL